MRLRTRDASFLKHLTGPDDLGLRRGSLKTSRGVVVLGKVMDVGHD